MSNDSYQMMFKIVVIGSSGVGKSNISTRYVCDQFIEGQKVTINAQFLSKTITVHNRTVKLALWDTAGQEQYSSLSKLFYKGAVGVLLVYDVTDPQSYIDLQSWMRSANENANLNQVALMIVGNKADLKDDKKVTTQRPIRQYKEKFDIDCWEVSAKTGQNIQEVFTTLAEEIYEMNMIRSEIESEIRASMIEGSLINPEENNYNNRMSKKISAILEESEPDMTEANYLQHLNNVIDNKGIKLIQNREQKRKRRCC